MVLPTLLFDPEIKAACPNFRIGIVACDITDYRDVAGLHQTLDQTAIRLQERFDNTTLKQRETVAATRMAYKRCGKDPNRYRPAAEQLSRRIINGLGVYKVHPLVDLGNVISIETGYSMGVFERTAIDGQISMGIGRADEPFEGIGRGALNIEGLPVYRDNQGAFASPTSDSERTKVLADTKKVLIFVNDFGTPYTAQKDLLTEVLAITEALIRKHTNVVDYQATIQHIG